MAIFVVNLLRYHRIDIASLCLIVLEVECQRCVEYIIYDLLKIEVVGLEVFWNRNFGSWSLDSSHPSLVDGKAGIWTNTNVY